MSCAAYVLPMHIPMTSICVLHVFLMRAELWYFPMIVMLVMVIMVTAVMIRMVALTTMTVVIVGCVETEGVRASHASCM